MIRLKSTGLNALVDPLDVENDLSFLTGILAIKALTTFVMRVNCDRSKPLFQHGRNKRTEDIWNAAVARRNCTPMTLE